MKGTCAVPEGTRSFWLVDPALTRWAKLFRPAWRDWIWCSKLWQPRFC
jgi:hypothetical protein